MNRVYASALALAILTTVCAISATAQVKQTETPLSYTVSMSKPQTHLLEVQVVVTRGSGQWPTQETLIMPVWTPGSYLVREYARHVQDFAATSATGQPLE